MNLWIRKHTSLIFSKTNLFNDYRNTNQPTKSVEDRQSVNKAVL